MRIVLGGETRQLALAGDKTADPAAFLKRLSDLGKVSFRLGETAAAVEVRALSALAGPAGGYATPVTIAEAVEVALAGGQNVVRGLADLVRTDDGGDYFWPSSDDTGNEGELLAENAPRTSLDLAFARKRFGAYKHDSRRVAVPSELLEDGGPVFWAGLLRMLAGRVARLQNRLCTTGTGGGQPQGVVSAAFVGVTAASQTAVTADEVLDLAYACDPAYRDAAGAGFMMHSNVLKIVKKLKAATGGDYVYTPPTAPGQPAMIDRWPVYVNNHMASALTASARTLLFGDYSMYKVLEVREAELKMYYEAPGGVDNDAPMVAVTLRADGALLDAGTHPVVALQQAA